MADDPSATAREILADLETRLATKDPIVITEQWADDAVLIGDDANNFTRDEVAGYLRAMAEMAPTVRWSWDQVAAIECAPNVLAISAAGSLSFYDPSGQPLAPEAPFRLSCVAVHEDGSWRLKQFHGSQPHA
jgi:uncharacterized protein (TIGR02246 family)